MCALACAHGVSGMLCVNLHVRVCCVVMRVCVCEHAYVYGVCEHAYVYGVCVSGGCARDDTPACTCGSVREEGLASSSGIADYSLCTESTRLLMSYDLRAENGFYTFKWLKILTEDYLKVWK